MGYNKTDFIGPYFRHVKKFMRDTGVRNHNKTKPRVQINIMMRTGHEQRTYHSTCMTLKVTWETV